MWSRLRHFYLACIEIRGEPRPKWELAIGIISVAIVFFGYCSLSHKQHLKNPQDRTIPTVTQIWQGVVNVTENIYHWQDRWQTDHPEALFPSFEDLKVGTQRMFTTPEAEAGNTKPATRVIVVDSKATFTRLFYGLFFGITFSVLAGLFMGNFWWIKAALYPLLSFFAKVPPTAAMAIFFVLIGLNESMYAWVIAAGIVPTLALTVYNIAKDEDTVPMELIYKGHTLGASRLEIVWRICFPASLPKIIDAISLTIGPAMVFLIAAEMLVGDVGIGYRIRLEGRKPQMDIVYFYLAYLAIIGMVIANVLTSIRNVLCPFANRSRHEITFTKRVSATAKWLVSGPWTERSK